MKSKGFINQAGILILCLLVIFTLAGCDNNSNNTNQVSKYSVSGTVLDTGGNPIADVSLAIKGSEIQDSSVEVDENGMWSAADLQGEVTVTPVKADWTFTPPKVIVSEKDDGKNDFNFVGQEIIFPGVETLTPGENTLDVETGAVVAVEFNQDVTEVDLTGITITDSGANPVGGVTASLSGRNLTINHADFNFNTIYTVTIPANTVENNDGVGNKDISWSFTTRNSLAPPTVSVLTPAENSTNVELAAVVSVEFDQNITEEDLSGISITNDGGSTTVAGVSASLSDRTITINHVGFDYGKTYTVTVPAGAVINTDGIENNELSWSFTTRDALPAPAYNSLTPGKNATDVEPGAIVSIEFDQDVIEVDLNEITIKDSNNNLVGNVSASLIGPVIIISHADFNFVETYTVTVLADVVVNEDGVGNNEISWSFTTRDALPAPVYVSLIPGENTTEVEPGATVSIEFDQDIIEENLNGITIEDSSNNSVTGVVASVSDRTIIIDHDDFYYSKTYTVTIPAGAVTNIDRIGNNEIGWNFTTMDAYRLERILGNEGSRDGEFKYPAGIAVDGSGNIYVADVSNHRIQKFDSSGNYLTQWGSQGSGDGEFDLPFGIAVDGSGNIYVADFSNCRIQKFDSSGNYLNQWGSWGSGDGEFKYPEGIAVDGSGNIYVADTLNHRIQKFDSSGDYLTQWGSYGIGDGEFRGLVGIAVDSPGNIYVADSENHRIQKFDSNGNYLNQWGSQGTGDGEFDLPFGITVDSSGNVYVADAKNHRIQKFDSNGGFITACGKDGNGDGEFNNPEGIAVDSYGNVYVADTGNHRIQKFVPIE